MKKFLVILLTLTAASFFLEYRFGFLEVFTSDLKKEKAVLMEQLKNERKNNSQNQEKIRELEAKTNEISEESRNLETEITRTEEEESSSSGSIILPEMKKEDKSMGNFSPKTGIASEPISGCGKEALPSLIPAEELELSEDDFVDPFQKEKKTVVLEGCGKFKVKENIEVRISTTFSNPCFNEVVVIPNVKYFEYDAEELIVEEICPGTIAIMRR